MAALTSTEVLIPGVISIRDENHGERPAEEPAEIAISHPGVASGGSGTSADPKFVEVHGDPVSEFTMQLPFMLWPAGRLVGAEATTGKSLVAAEAKGGIIAGEEALATGKVGVSGGTAVEEIGAVGKAGTELGAAEAGAAPFQGPKSLREMAREIWKLGGGGPANGRTIAVGVAEDGTLHGGSSNWWTKAQRDYTDRMGIKRAMGSDALHAEGEILRGIDRGKIPRIESIGTYPPMPCDKPNFMCAERLEKRGINVVQGTGMGADPLRRSEFG